MKLFGQVAIFINGKPVLVDNNTIHNDLKSHLIGNLSTPADQAINDLFTADRVIAGGLQDAKDGIILEIGSTTLYTMTTTAITQEPVEANGKRWRGEYTNTSGGAETASRAAIGHDFASAAWADVFNVIFATYTFSGGLALQDLDTLVMEWQINIAY